MIQLHLKGAYLIIPIHIHHQNVSNSKWSVSCKFKVLPFSLPTTPRVLTYILCLVITFLKGMSTCCSIYLDDILPMSQCREKGAATYLDQWTH